MHSNYTHSEPAFQCCTHSTYTLKTKCNKIKQESQTYQTPTAKHLDKPGIKKPAEDLIEPQQLAFFGQTNYPNILNQMCYLYS